MLALIGAIAVQPAALPSIVPQPASVVSRPGSFALTPRTHIVADDQDVAEYLRARLRASTGYALNITGHAARGDIKLILDRRVARLGPEGYTLNVKPDSVEIRASQPNGLFYGVQSFRQMLPPDVFRRAPIGGIRWTAPCASIEDSPRFAWRGMHMDVSRHFMPKEFVMKFLELMAIHKFNIFHWHLTDDNGWRIEIKRYPLLTSLSSDSDFSAMNPKGATRSINQRAGGYYTQDDIREIVQFARDRFITILPEIEMPGHSLAAITAYPELGNRSQIEAEGGDGSFLKGSDNVYNPSDATISFLKDVLAEVSSLFPSTFIHVGGDEVDKTAWKKNPVAQRRMRELGLKNEDELQSWFIRQFDTFLTQANRRLIGWDEILQGGLAPGAAVMSWRGIDGGIAAAKSGHDVVMAPTSHTYFDYYQAPAAKEPKAIGGYVPLQKVYSFEPIPDALIADQAKHILGAQAQLWAEFIPHPKHMEYMAFPRECALSEVVWSPKAARNYNDFLSRLAVHLQRLNALDVNYRPLDTPNDSRNSTRTRNERLSAPNARSERRPARVG